MALGPSLPQIGALQLLSARPQVSPRFLRAWHPAFVLARMPTVSTPNPGAGVRGHAPPGPQPRDLIPMSGGSSLGLRPLQPVLHTFSLSPDATFLSPFLPDLLVWDPGCLRFLPWLLPLDSVSAGLSFAQFLLLSLPGPLLHAPLSLPHPFPHLSEALGPRHPMHHQV